MKWEVSEYGASIADTPTLTVFQVREDGRILPVAIAQSSEHCGAAGWTADELRERVRLMAAAAALRDALADIADLPVERLDEAHMIAGFALALLDDSEVAA